MTFQDRLNAKLSDMTQAGAKAIALLIVLDGLKSLPQWAEEDAQRIIMEWHNAGTKEEA
jgi:hypothetical protein